MTSSEFESSDADSPTRGGARLVALIIAAAVFAALTRYLADSFGVRPALRALLVVLAFAAPFAAAVAVEWWRPRWLDNRNATLAWLVPRLVLIAFALSAIVATSGYRPSVPDCPEAFGSGGGSGISGGELLYASMRGDTFVCTYDDTSGSL